MKSIIFKTNQIVVKTTKNGEIILQFINKKDEHLEPTNSITEINICVSHIQSYWKEDKEPFMPKIFAPDAFDPEPGKLSFFIAISGIIYHFINNDYDVIHSVCKEFESHYLKEEKKTLSGPGLSNSGM